MDEVRIEHSFFEHSVDGFSGNVHAGVVSRSVSCVSGNPVRSGIHGWQIEHYRIAGVVYERFLQVLPSAGHGMCEPAPRPFVRIDFDVPYGFFGIYQFQKISDLFSEIPSRNNEFGIGRIGVYDVRNRRFPPDFYERLVDIVRDFAERDSFSRCRYEDFHGLFSSG